MQLRKAMLVTVVAVALCAAVVAIVQYPSYERAKRDFDVLRNERRVAAMISQAIGRGEGTLLDLDKLVDLPWNRVYVLAPYTTFESAQREMPGVWYTRDHDGIDVRDDICVLAFFDGAKLIARISQPRSPGDFSPAVRRGGYLRSEARFRLSGGQVMDDAG
jgi:hypothetical protein